MNKINIISLFMGLFFIANPIFSQENNKIKIDKDLQLLALQDSVFIHISWDKLEEYGRFSSNGLIIIRKGQALMVDTPMDNKKTKILTKYLSDSLNVTVVKHIGCHYHEDCIGGLPYLHSLGVESVANVLTVNICRTLNIEAPDIPFHDSLQFTFNGLSIECYYPGGGHTSDNIVVWLPEHKILFGGCLIKSANATNLGNISDAIIPEWDISIVNISKRYMDAVVVVPGHGDYGDTDLYKKTVGLVIDYKMNN